MESGAPSDDIIDVDRVLAAPESEAEQIRALGQLLGEALKDVEVGIGKLSPGTRRAMADHFWCELIVALVVLIEESNRLLDSVPDKLAERICKARADQGLTNIERRVVAACAEQIWKRLQGALGLSVITDAEVVLPALRTLAVLMCKSPPKHPAVVQHCVDPLEQHFAEETKQRLLDTLEEFVPQIEAGQRAVSGLKAG